MTSSTAHRDRHRIAASPRTVHVFVPLHEVQATRHSCVASPALRPLHFLVDIMKKNVWLRIAS